MKTFLAMIGWLMVSALAADVVSVAIAQTADEGADDAPTSQPEGEDAATVINLASVVAENSAQVLDQAEAARATTEAAALSDLEAVGVSDLSPPAVGDRGAAASLSAVDRSSSNQPLSVSAASEPSVVLVVPADGQFGIATTNLSELADLDDRIAQSNPQPLPEIPEDALETDADVLPTFRLSLVPVTEPVVPANRRSIIEFEGRITDADGTLVPHDVVVTLTTGAGEFQGADYDADTAGFQVLARQGQFAATLRSSLEAQQVRIRAAASAYAAQGIDEQEAVTLDPLPPLETFTQVEFATNLRPTLVSGVVDLRIGPGGTNFWGSYADFLDPDDIGDTEFDLGAALFATGSLGEWQFTGALNTRRALNETCDGNRLFRNDQFCDNTYPVYGDSSQNDYLTPSIDSFFIRFQRDAEVAGGEADYFMWGDYETLEFARSSQEFTAITRQLHGFKGNYTLGNFQLTAMYANNLRPFQRDTIAPDGTSGFYFLSRRVILPGSENVFIETEELNRPGTVIERRQLNRVSDYEIDYDRGSLLFRQPVYRTRIDPLGKTLVNRIVVTYQVDTADGGDLYAGRLQYNFKAGQPDVGGWAGITLISEAQGDQDFSLYGADVQIPLGATGSLTGEYAHSYFERFGESADGNAYRLEAQGPLFTPTVQGLAYLRSADEGFSNTATTSFRPGQTRWGAAVNAAVGQTTRLNFQFDQEINRGVAPEVLIEEVDLFNPGQFAEPGERVDNTLTTYRAGVRQSLGSVNVGLDYVNRDRTDRLGDTSANSQQFVPQLAVPITGDLSFRAQSEINVGDDDDLAYPDRTTLALDWAVQPGVTMRLSQQFISSSGADPRNITSLDTLVDYELGDNTSLRSRYSLIGGYGGLIGQAALGLNHRIILAPGLRATLGVEHVINDAFNNTGAGEQFEQPFAVGLGGTSLGILGGTSYSVGLEYTNNPDFQASARVEHRDSSSGSNTVFTAAAAGKVTNALTTLFRFQTANFANQTITGELGNSTDLKLGMAYRNPISDQWNALMSYEYRRNPATSPDSLLIDSGIGSSDHTLSLEAIYAPSWQWEFYGKYAFRISDATLADDFEFSNSIHLMQFRTSYQFAYRWDVLGEVRYITQPEASFNEVGTSIELGYYLTPDLRLGVGYSFGSVDNDGFGGGYRSASGPYFGVQLKVNELLNGFGIQPDVVPPQQEESLVDTALTPEEAEAVDGAAPADDVSFINPAATAEVVAALVDAASDFAAAFSPIAAVPPESSSDRGI
ncbi:MAG: TonB-dependent receptor [Leptolyngbya sp. SIOISBB]|nr:TonB-dependent receptor [Leptolyngbya sp. SIOISBB]